MHPDYATPYRRAALYRLFDRVWPGLAAKVETAARLGWRWDEVTTPFARFSEVSPASGSSGQPEPTALGHVGVLDLPVLLDGTEHRIAGLHAVCTHPDHRGRGHFRETMEAALRHVDQRWEVAKLSTAQPQLYEHFGFRVVEQHRFVVEAAGRGDGAARPLEEEDVGWLHALLAHRDPPSRRFAALDSGWLLGIDEVLWTGGLTHLHAVEDAVVAWEPSQGGLQIYDVVAREIPPLDALLRASPWPFERVVLWFTPDRLAPQATPIPWPDDDVLMVRGPWPLRGPLAVSPLAAH
jgi:GNAT superfamily N-acetyltransferase